MRVSGLLSLVNRFSASERTAIRLILFPSLILLIASLDSFIVAGLNDADSGPLGSGRTLHFEDQE